jgi:hypothetical protein
VNEKDSLPSEVYGDFSFRADSHVKMRDKEQPSSYGEDMGHGNMQELPQKETISKESGLHAL